MTEKDWTEKLQDGTFKSVISLGSSCPVAEDLEILGYRDGSYPFDWTISNFIGVMNVLETKFKDYISYDHLSQHSKHPHIYRNDLYDIQFLHDFSANHSLKEQILSVSASYERKIQRFLKATKEPTLFIRYIDDQVKDPSGRSAELSWIEKNWQLVLKRIHSFNPENEVIYIVNDTEESTLPFLYKVKPDRGDTVNRHPLQSQPELSTVFKETNWPQKINNLKYYQSTTVKRNKRLHNIDRKIQKLHKLTRHCYLHPKQF